MKPFSPADCDALFDRVVELESVKSIRHLGPAPRTPQFVRMKHAEMLTVTALLAATHPDWPHKNERERMAFIIRLLRKSVRKARHTIEKERHVSTNRLPYDA